MIHAYTYIFIVKEYVCVCMNVYVYVYVSIQMYVHYSYHGCFLLLERHGVNCLSPKPILVPDQSGGEQLEWTGNILHIYQPFQYRVEPAYLPAVPIPSAEAVDACNRTQAAGAGPRNKYRDNVEITLKYNR